MARDRFGGQARQADDMAARIATFDWSGTPLGGRSGWDGTLVAFSRHVLDSPRPAALFWGDELIALFNDAYAATLTGGEAALAGRYADLRREIWPALEPVVVAALAGRGGQLPVRALSAIGPATLDIVPVRDADGRVVGLIETVIADEAAAARAMADATPDRIETFAAVRDPDGAISGFRAVLANQAARADGVLTLDDDLIARFRTVLASGVAEHMQDSKGDTAERTIAPAADGIVVARRSTAPARAAAAEIDRLRLQVEKHSLRASEALSRALVIGVAQAVWETDADGRIVADSPSWRAFTGQTLEEWLDDGWLDAIHPDDRDQVEQRWRDNVKVGRTVNSEFRLHHAATRTWRWTNVRAVPIRSQDGAIEAWVGMNIDVHDRKIAEEGLRESEERLRSAVQVGRLGLWDWNIRTGEVTWSEEHFRMEGYDVGAVRPSYEAWIDRVHPDDRAAAEAALKEAMASQRDFAHEFRSLHPDGSVHWLYGRGRFFYDPEGAAYRMVGAMIDTTELRRAAERQAVLLAELQHRVRNILAVIHSVVRRSNDGERSTDEYVQHLEGRLSALARTQVLLTRRAGAGVEVEEIVRNELLVQVAHEGQFTLDGPLVVLAPKAAEVLSLAIHELATNATKYGAFMRKGGTLTVTWRVELRNGADWLSLVWRERGVPVLDPAPRRQGFGTELIERRVPYELKGHGSMTLRPGGMESRIEFPLESYASILETGGPGL